MSKIFEANFRPTNVSREHQIRSSDVLGFSGFDDEQRIGVDVKLQPMDGLRDDNRDLRLLVYKQEEQIKDLQRQIQELQS